MPPRLAVILSPSAPPRITSAPAPPSMIVHAADGARRIALAAGLDTRDDLVRVTVHRPAVPEDRVVTAATGDFVAGRTADDNIRTVAADDGVDTARFRLGGEDVVACRVVQVHDTVVAQDDVVTHRGRNVIVTRTAQDDVVASRAADDVVAAHLAGPITGLGSARRRHLSDQQTGARNIAAVANQDVVTGAADDLVADLDFAAIDDHRLAADTTQDDIANVIAAAGDRVDATDGGISRVHIVLAVGRVQDGDAIVSQDDLAAQVGRDLVPFGTAENDVTSGTAVDVVHAALGPVGLDLDRDILWSCVLRVLRRR